jgi:general secretion pathway protein N
LRAAIILLVVVFLATVLVRLPARVLLSVLPADVSCESPAGTIWSGSCGELRAGAAAVSGVSWRLHPAALLRLRLAAELVSEDPGARGHAQVELAPNGDLAISALAAQVALPGRIGLVGAGTSGSLQLAIDSAHVAAGHLTALHGMTELRQLHIANPPTDLGSYELRFVPPEGAAPAAGGSEPMLGQLRDLDGPLAVSGELRLLPTGSYELNGTLAPRPGASADLSQLLAMLGAPDEQGRRTFSLAGTL